MDGVKLKTKREGLISYRELRGHLKAALSGEEGYIVRSHSDARAILIPLTPPLSLYYVTGKEKATIAKAKALFAKALERLEEI